jgi:hypothetical protein
MRSLRIDTDGWTGRNPWARFCRAGQHVGQPANQRLRWSSKASGGGCAGSATWATCEGSDLSKPAEWVVCGKRRYRVMPVMLLLTARGSRVGQRPEST